jgi:hexosaminidase
MSMIAIIPKPEKCIEESGTFQINKNTTIFAPELLIPISQIFLDILTSKSNIPLHPSSTLNPQNSIRLEQQENETMLGEEGYRLTITPNLIKVVGAQPAGIFYGLQTLLQIIFQNSPIADTISIPCIAIEDKPRFPWRGLMFDVARHYHPMSTIKKTLDLMALFKMNRFHFHLTEDQGWRIEIKKYPKLIEIGSKRKDTRIGGFFHWKLRGKPHEGYYTQEQIKEIVKYAAERFITVIPEIELPGHSIAAISSYPELSCRGLPIEIETKRGIYADVYCAGKETTFQFLQDVFDEVIQLFPAEIIHIGGDEVPKKRWKECANCQARIQKEKLPNEHALQVYFTNRIATYLKSKGKRIMGWNEILGDNLDPTAIAQWWIPGKSKVLQHLRQGRNFVMSLLPFTYLDYNYLVIPLRKMYAYNPIPKELEVRYQSAILGIETPIWTEWVPTQDRLEWQVFPRLLAIAENAWTPQMLHDYSEFKTRLESILKILDLFNVQYADLSEVDPSNWYRFTHLGSWFQWPEI